MFPEHSQAFPPQSCNISCFCSIVHSFILTHDSNKRLNIASITDKGFQHQLRKTVICEYFVTDVSILCSRLEIIGNENNTVYIEL